MCYVCNQWYDILCATLYILHYVVSQFTILLVPLSLLLFKTIIATLVVFFSLYVSNNIVKI